nr:B3 domain-containing protein At5g57720-like isoform X1 [Ipomoea batatas]
MFDFIVLDSSGCEKIIVDGKEARVKWLKNNNDGDVNCQDNTFLVEFEVNMVTQVKKDKDEMDAEEEKNDVIGFQHHMSRSKGKRCITAEGGFKRAASMKKRSASPKRGKKNARAKKRDVSAEKMDASEEKKDGIVKNKKDVHDHLGVELFSSGCFTQPKNPYFVTKIRPRRPGELYIPFEVIRNHNIELPAKVILRDEKGKNWNTYVKTWSDGRTWLYGEWLNLCRQNLVQENDRCICEFMPSNSSGKELVMQVTIIRRKDLEAQPN